MRISVSMIASIPGRCTFRAIGVPSLSQARWTWAMEADAIGISSIRENQFRMIRTLCFDHRPDLFRNGSGFVWSWGTEVGLFDKRLGEEYLPGPGRDLAEFHKCRAEFLKGEPEPFIGT